MGGGAVVCLGLWRGMENIQNMVHRFEKGSEWWHIEARWLGRQGRPHSLVENRQSSGRWPICIF